MPAVELRGITKRFPAVVANDGVDFEAAEGEVHALLGENGAGKSTLSNILTGLYRPDDGEILLYGRPVEFHSPRDALDAGICMVHQHFRLVAPFGPSVSAKTKAAIAAKMKALKAGTFYEFEGPLYDQSGKLRVKKGVRLTVTQLYAIDWLVKGIEGSAKG